MKHFTQTTANGLCTPPCCSSQGKSTRFSLFTSLLLFFLLFVGSNAVWARPTIYGEGLPGLNASGAANWNNNTKEMSAYGEANTYYAEFLNVAATDNNTYRFKIAVNDAGDWWSGAMDSNNTNESMGNVDIVSANETQISFKMPFAGDVYVFYKSSNANDSKVWIVAVPQNVAAAPNNSGKRKLKTDIILKDGSNDWTSDGIKFEKNDAVSTYKHVTSYVLPAKKSTEGGAIRFEMCYGDKPDVYVSGKDPEYRAQLSTSTPRRIIYLWDGNNEGSWIAYTLPTYPVRKTGWKLFVKDYNSGNPTTMDANGSATLTLNGGSSYEFFIANTDDATNLSTYSQSAAATYPAVHSVNWFGGCYVDKNNSSNVTFNDIQVYKSDKLGTLTHPVVDSHHLQGKFQVSGSGTKDVTFTFDGGKITINAVDHGAAPEPEPTDRTYDGTEYMFFHKNQTSTEANHDHDFSNDDARLFVHFKNAGVDNTSERAFFWDADRTIYAVKVPAGTYKTFKIYRISREIDGWYEWNHSYELNLDYVNDYNYLSATSTSAPTWTTYTPPTFRFVLSGTPALSGDNGEFSHWNGDGTVYTGSTTKNLAAGTYKFKVNPAGVTTANNMWVNEFNWSAVDLAHSSNDISLQSQGDYNNIQFTLSQTSDVTIACDGHHVTVNATPSAPEPLSGDYYVFGAGGTNWVTGWTRNVEANKMTIVDGVATKTFYNVSGQGLEFKIHKGETEYNNSLLLEEVGENNSHLIKKVWKNDTNIDFSISDINVTHKADVTVHFDGEHIWLTAVPHPETVAGSEWYIMGSGNVGTEHNLEWDKNTQKGRGNEHKMTVQDGVATITYYNVPNNSISYKVFRGSDNYEINDFYYDASASSGIICTDQDGNDNINVSLNNQNICIHWDGTKIWTTQAAAPITTYTVTLHPNNGSSNIVRTNVPEGSNSSAAALNLAAITYGAGTATWYTNPECTAPFSTVTGNMDLYAKWGVSGNYYIVGCLQTASDGGDSGNWSNTLSRQMTYESGSSGKCSFTFVAPSGKYPFEIIKNQSWSEKINGGNYDGMFDNSISDVTISATGGHLMFELASPKKVTVSYNGKVSVKVEDYSFDNSKTWRIKTSWDTGEGEWHYNTVMTNNGTTNATAILRNVSGTRSFIISTKTIDNDAQAVIGNETFNALYVDMTSPSTGLTWNTTSAKRDGSDNFNSTTPQADGNYWRNCKFTLSEQSDIRITFDGGKIRCDILPKYTVTFNSNGGSEVAAQSVFEGATASEPSAPTKAGCNFQGWQLSGANYSFSSAVTGNITLDAVWANKPISSVELNESEHTTWVGNSDFVLTLTKNPSDLITKSVVWSSDAEGVASVSNGTVHAVGVGTATITCTVTDMFDTQRSATCEVTVAACQMTTDDLYSMTVTGYNSSTGDDATLTGLWNQSSDNTEPATFRIVKLKLSNNYYIYDDNGTVKMSTDASLAAAQWYEIPTNENFSPNWTGNNFALYEFKNVSTGKYLHRGEGRYGDNSSWYYYTTLTDNRETDGNIYKFFYDNTMGTHLVCREGVGNELRVSYALHNNNLNWAAGYSDHCAAPMVICGYTNDPNGNTYTKLHETVVVDPSYANPNYKASQMNSAYYRMKADATVRANLANGLAYGSVITVRLYADAATSVKLQTAAGDDVETINLSADAAREYTYTVAYGSELVGATAFIIKAADNHAGIASIEVSRMHAVDPSSPALTWDADLSEGVTQSALAGTFQHVASSALSSGAIHYTSSNEAVATVAADGTVTPIMAGNTTITATIEQHECYAEQSINYNVTLTEPTLAEMIAADAGAGITLTHDYAENIVIDKAVTINGAGHAIGNLTVQTAGDLTLSGALTVNDFSIYAQAGNTTTPAASGQVRNAANLTANGNAYFYYTVDPSGTVHYGWYDFTVPFRVNVMTGIKGIQDAVLKENFVNETDYAIMEHLGDKQAAGQYAYKKFRGIMEPCRLYSITLDDDFNYNTIRFQKADGALVAGNEVTLNAYASTVDDKHANWNGVGNGTLHHADAILSTVGYIQVYQSGEKTFLPVDKNEYSLVVGSAFMVQQAGTMTLNQASHDKLLAPRRDASAQATAIQIAREGKPFSDQLYITADELAGQGYTQGVDVAKAGNIGNVNVPQIWTNAYNSKLCAHEAQLINGEAQYTLSLYAPANGTYTLTSKNIPEGYTLYLTQNGNKLWDMSDTYVLDLTKGTTTEYGLLLVENYKMPTAVDNIFSNTDETTKIMRNGILYILQNGKVFNAQGARVK